MSQTKPQSDNDKSSGDLDLRAILDTLWRSKWTLLLFICLALLWGGYQAFVAATPKYTASATLVLQARTEQVVDIQSVVSGVSTDLATLNTEIEVMRSGKLLRLLLDELSLDEDPEFNAVLREKPRFSIGQLRSSIRLLLLSALGQKPKPVEPNTAGQTDAAINALRSAISVVNRRNTYVFVISAKTQNPAKSALIANTLADLYIQDQINIKFKATENATNWLSERVVELEKELEQKEELIKQARAAMSAVSAEAVEAINQQARNLRERLAKANSDRDLQEARVSELNALRDSGDLQAMADAEQDPTLNRLLRLAQDGSDEARAAFLDRFDVNRSQASALLARTDQQASALQASLQQLEESASQQTDRLIRLQQLEREAEATRTLYETFLTRLKETSLQIGLQQADSRVLSDATTGRYVEPRKSRILMLSAVLGFLAGAAMLFVRQMRNNRFLTPEDLKTVSTTIPVLGQIPVIRGNKRHTLIEYLSANPTSATVEAVRNLRTSVLLSALDHPPQVILSTSSIPGEGKTTLTVALAHNLAGLGKKVLLVECDLRRNTLSQYFNRSAPKQGLVAANLGEIPLEDVVFFDETGGFDVILGQVSQINAADFFSSEVFEAFLRGLRERYDFIILDTPPVLVVSDGRILAQLADKLLFSVAWDSTSQAQVQAAMAQLDMVPPEKIGFILSRVDIKGMMRYGYGGQYGAYSTYGNQYYSS
jgi:succinoglycan biosynthesis transport protein ExoP